MADNVQITPGAGTIIRAVDIGGVQYQVLIQADAAGNLVGSTLGNNGRGHNVVVLNDVPVVGVDADDAIMQSANWPVYMGGRVRLGTSILPLAADGDAGGLTLTGDRRLVTAPIGCPEDQGPTTPIIAANDTNVHTFIAAQASLVKIALWGLEMTNLSANAVGVIFSDGATEIGRVACGAAPGRTVTFAAPLKSSPAVALNYQLVQIGGALPGVNQLYLTPFWYRTRA
jgi:hypothetical protein